VGGPNVVERASAERERGRFEDDEDAGRVVVAGARALAGVAGERRGDFPTPREAGGSRRGDIDATNQAGVGGFAHGVQSEMVGGGIGDDGVTRGLREKTFLLPPIAPARCEAVEKVVGRDSGDGEAEAGEECGNAKHSGKRRGRRSYSEKELPSTWRGARLRVFDESTRVAHLRTRAAVVATLRAQGRLIVQAPTGSGKSTQIPQMLLRHGLLDGGEVVVLQPRRLAARMLAKRVAEEVGTRLGDIVGYQIRLESRVSAATRIRFVTEGILLRQMSFDATLRGSAPRVRRVSRAAPLRRHLAGPRAADPATCGPT
jgi:hypothetical protein